eukprot:scaffold6070_cov41-Cyclotella_meneghiniana.AAC.3
MKSNSIKLPQILETVSHPNKLQHKPLVSFSRKLKLNVRDYYFNTELLTFFPQRYHPAPCH